MDGRPKRDARTVPDGRTRRARCSGALAPALAAATLLLLVGPPGAQAALRGDAEAARLVRSAPEIRPGNAAANHRIPTAEERQRFRAQNRLPAVLHRRVT